jgi:hypothetical protein
VRLDPETIEILADAIAKRLSEGPAVRSGWVTADVVASYLGVDVAYVYEHSERLGAGRLGDGRKARLRFRLELVEETLCVAGRASGEVTTPSVKAKGARRRSRRLGSGVQLLPIKGIRGPIA